MYGKIVFDKVRKVKEALETPAGRRLSTSANRIFLFLSFRTSVASVPGKGAIPGKENR